MCDAMNPDSVANRFLLPLMALIRIANLIGLSGHNADIEGRMQRFTEFRQQLPSGFHVGPVGSIQEQDFGTAIHQTVT